MPIPDFNFFLETEPVCRVKRALTSGTFATSALLLHGEDGLGKSSAVLHALKAEPETIILHGTPSPYRTPYHPVAEALAAFVRRAGHSTRFKEAAVGIAGDLMRLVPVLGSFGEPLLKVYKDWGVGGVAPLSQPYDIVYQVQKILSRLADKHRVVVLFEDITLYDSASLSLLGTVLKNTSLPVSCVLTVDPVTRNELSREEREGFDRFESQVLKSGFRRIEFRPLSVADTRAFLDGYLHPNLLTATQVGTMHAITGGNPLFLKEMVTHLLDESILGKQSGAFTIPPDYSFASVPHSMSQLIDMRVRRLQAELRDVIDVAAVLGLEFSPQPISGTLKLEHMVTLKRLKEIETTHQLIVETTRAHVFTYRSIRERIYAQLGPALAREHHLLIASYLARHPCLDDNEYAIYHHFAEAGNLRSALPHLRTAAYESRARLSYAEAAVRFREASRLTRQIDLDSESADELLFEAAHCHANAGLFREAIESFTWLANEARQPQFRRAALLQLGLTQWIGDGPQEAMHNLNLLLERHAGELDERAEVEARLALSSVLYHVGEWETARSHYRKCFRTSLIRQDPLLRAWARRCINMFYTCDAALPLLRESLRDVHGSRELPLYWELRHNVACNHMLSGELAEARAIFEEVLAWFDQVGTYRAIYTENDLGIIAMAEGKYGEAERRFQRVATTPVSPFERISADCQLGVLRVLQGDFGGLEAIERLVPEATSRPELFTREMVFHNLGWAQMLAGQREAAARNLVRALPEHRSPGSSLAIGRIHRLLKRLSAQGVGSGHDVEHSPELALLEHTGRRDRWWYSEMDYMCNDLWCWE